MSASQPLQNLRSFSVRFLFVSVIPSVTLILAVLLLVFSGAAHHAPKFTTALRTLDHLGGMNITLIIFGGTIVSMMLHPMQFSMIQVLEGYWGSSRIGTYAALLASRRFDRRFRRLDKAKTSTIAAGLSEEDAVRLKAIYERSLDSLPVRDRLMPTRLGNVLRAGEDFAGNRYGLDAVQVIPRIYPQLLPEIASPLDDSRLQLDVSVRLCLVWTLVTAASLAMLARSPRWLWIPVIMYFLAWLSYRAACAAAEGYGVMLAVAIDMHRFDFLQAMHKVLPRNYKEEKFKNQILTAILAGSYIESEADELPRSSYRHPTDTP
jgi:hypothetical protein